MRYVSGVLLVLGCGLGISPLACGDAQDRDSQFHVEDPAPITSSTAGSSGAQADRDASSGYGGTTGTGGRDPVWVQTAPAQGGSETGGGTACAQNKTSIEPLPPDILIVQDRSMSMTQDSTGKSCAGGSPSGDGNCGETSKWYQVTQAIKAVVNDTQKTVNWGMFWLGNETAECGVAAAPVVPITPDESSGPIGTALDANVFNGAIGTPTAKAVNNAVAYLQTLTDPNPKFLLVATDGEPNCANGSSMGTDVNGAQSAVAAAKKAGIPTFVVGIAVTTNPTATQALNAMATAGGEAQKTGATQYYAVTDTESLVSTLNQIIGLTLPCKISLADTPKGDWSVAIAATDAASGEVVEVPADPDNGWAYTDNTKSAIQLNGDACTKLKSGNYSDFGFIYTCVGQKPRVY